MLRWRLISAAVIIAFFAGLCWLDLYWNFGRPGIWLLVVGVAVVPAAAGEIVRLLQSGGHRPLPWVIHAGILLVFGSATVPVLWRDYPDDCPLGKLGWPLSALAAALVLAFIGEMLRYREPGQSIVPLSLSFMAIGYVGLLSTFFVALRLHGGNQWGMVALVSLIAVVKMGDTGAYTLGQLAGRHKLAPTLSPGKTVEGAVGGILASWLGAWVVFHWVAPQIVTTDFVPPAWWAWMAYGTIVALAGMIGDLAESLLKRDVGQKDSSGWLPGLGGVLDTMDSLLIAAPAAYMCWIVGLVGP